MLAWLRRHVAEAEALIEPPRLSIEAGPKRLTFRLHQQIGDSESGGDWLIIMREVSDESVIDLERVFAKLGVETRTAAAGMAMGRIRQLHPQFEG